MFRMRAAGALVRVSTLAMLGSAALAFMRPSLMVRPASQIGARAMAGRIQSRVVPGFRLFSTEVGTAPEAVQTLKVEWKDDSTAQISWSPAPTGAAPRSPSHKVKFRRGDEGVYNALTVGGEGAATLRSLEPGSKYHVQVFRLGQGADTSVTLVAEALLETRKAEEKPKGEVTELSRLEIRVGRILDIAQHPDADSLYVEQVDVGEPEPRTIVSGLVKYQSVEQLKGRDVIVLCNLKPRAMRGVTSHGMLLCASNEDHSVVEPLSPPAGTPVGELITFDGHAAQPEPAGNRASKAFDRIAEDLFSTDDKLATYKGTPFMTSNGPVTAAMKGSIS